MIEPQILHPQTLTYEAEDIEHHSVPFGRLDVAALKVPELRTAIEMFWEPDFRDERTPSVEKARAMLEAALDGIPDFEGFSAALRRDFGPSSRHAKIYTPPLREAGMKLAASVDAIQESIEEFIGEASADDDEEELEFETLSLGSPDSHDLALYRMLYKIVPIGRQISQRLDRPAAPHVRVRILLDYPLTHHWTYVATLPADRLGRVFAIAHDMYQAIYAKDDAAWKADLASNGDEVPEPFVAPRNRHFAHNRGHGKFVWGHDIEDLVFTSLVFAPEPDLEPLDPERQYDETPILGTITFDIDS